MSQNFENVNKTGVKTYLKKRKNFLKKCLTNAFGCGKVNKLSQGNVSEQLKNW